MRKYVALHTFFSRFEDRDPRTRGRYSRERQRQRSRDRVPRQGRRSRSKSNDRFSSGGAGRRNRSNWKKGPVSPEPPPPPMSSNSFNMPPQQIYDPNVYNANYPQNQMGYQQPYPNYEYPLMQQQPPPFTAYPPPPQGVIQPILPPGI